MKIAVIGAGIFGCVSALKLSKKLPNDTIHLYERNSGIFHEASGINQYRLHEGYHYPRSPETIEQCQSGIESFFNEYSDCFVNSGVHMYAVSKDSKVSSSDYTKILDRYDLKYYNLDKKKFNLTDNIESLFGVKEESLHLPNFKIRMLEDLIKSRVIVFFDTVFTKQSLKYYDVVVNCSYSNLNFLLEPEEQIDYQFELCEKPIIKLEYFEDLSIVVIDGPFMCIDPLFGTSLHVMGHVKHAIHSTNIGKFPIIEDRMKPFVNKIQYPYYHSNFDKMVEDGKKYFNYFNPYLLESMMVIRTVLPMKDDTDERPSYITKHSDKLYSVFSGKISTCVDIANQLCKMI